MVFLHSHWTIQCNQKLFSIILYQLFIEHSLYFQHSVLELFMRTRKYYNRSQNILLVFIFPIFSPKIQTNPSDTTVIFSNLTARAKDCSGSLIVLWMLTSKLFGMLYQSCFVLQAFSISQPHLSTLPIDAELHPVTLDSCTELPVLVL